ncbi:glycosyltransferase [uncultured Draconibacterium sp.]|uniref:glycosyltransferase n=1 Tax=uncultured Draconibacterium sp. TaxID=1573823 RepID=UPI0025DC4877|nr:glycosyltransferase [uncultured Draconibacterium sp.]
MALIFFPKYHQEGPSSRYRTYKYLEYFKEKKLDYQYFPFFYNGYVRDLYKSDKSFVRVITSYLKRLIKLFRVNKKNNFLVIEKELFPGIPYLIEKLFLKKGQYSIDYDDAVFLKYSKIPFLREKHIKLCKNAKFVTCGNKWYFKQLPDANCYFLPTVIDTPCDNFKHVNTNQKLIICWIGTPSNINYLKDLVPVFRSLQNKGLKFKLRVIGCYLNDPDIDIENLAWSEEKEFDYLRSSDIGIMPLFNSDWENGKCGFKLLQYMSAKLPVIGSPSAANSEIIKHNKNGFLAKTHSEWEHYLSILYSNKELRINFGNAGFDLVSTDYSFSKWKKKYYSMLTK